MKMKMTKKWSSSSSKKCREIVNFMGLLHLKEMSREVEYLLQFYLRIRQYASFRTNTATMQGRKVHIHPQLLSLL